MLTSVPGHRAAGTTNLGLVIAVGCFVVLGVLGVFTVSQPALAISDGDDPPAPGGDPEIDSQLVPECTCPCTNSSDCFIGELDGPISTGITPLDPTACGSDGPIVSVVFRRGPKTLLDLSYLAEAVEDGDLCFDVRTLTRGTLIFQQIDDSSVAVAAFYFEGTGTDGTDVKYLLKMKGFFQGASGVPEEDPNFQPAAVGDIAFTVYDTWEVSRAQGRGRHVACEGAGSFPEDPDTGQVIPVMGVVERVQ